MNTVSTKETASGSVFGRTPIAVNSSTAPLGGVGSGQPEVAFVELLQQLLGGGLSVDAMMQGVTFAALPSSAGPVKEEKVERAPEEMNRDTKRSAEDTTEAKTSDEGELDSAVAEEQGCDACVDKDAVVVGPAVQQTSTVDSSEVVAVEDNSVTLKRPTQNNLEQQQTQPNQVNTELTTDQLESAQTQLQANKGRGQLTQAQTAPNEGGPRPEQQIESEYQPQLDTLGRESAKTSSRGKFVPGERQSSNGLVSIFSPLLGEAVATEQVSQNATTRATSLGAAAVSAMHGAASSFSPLLSEGLAGKTSTSGSDQSVKTINAGAALPELHLERQNEGKGGTVQKLPGSLQTKIIDRIKQIAEEISVNKTSNSVVLRLDPPELGEMLVKITQRSDQLFAKIQAESPEVEQTLKQNMPEVIQALTVTGFKAENIHVQIGQEPTESDLFAFSQNFSSGKGSENQAGESKQGGLGQFQQAKQQMESALPAAVDVTAEVGWVA